MRDNLVDLYCHSLQDALLHKLPRVPSRLGVLGQEYLVAASYAIVLVWCIVYMLTRCSRMCRAFVWCHRSKSDAASSMLSRSGTGKFFRPFAYSSSSASLRT